jgi:hypothetical protein
LRNTHHSQDTGSHAPCGIRTRNLSKRANADLRPPVYWIGRTPTSSNRMPILHPPPPPWPSTSLESVGGGYGD